jgi:hypothetical protein
MGSPSPKSVSTLTDQQKELVNSLVDQILGPMKNGKRTGGMLTQGATKYSGQLTLPWANKFSGATQQALSAALSGKSAYDLDPEVTAQRFRDTVVNPGMMAFNKDILPQLREGFGQGGAFNSRMGVAESNALSRMNVGFGAELANMQFQNQNLAAQLASDAAGRQFGAAQFTTNIQQNALATQYQDAMRMAPEYNPWVDRALAITGQSQMALYQKPSIAGAIMGVGGSLIGAKMGGVGGAAIGYGAGSNLGSSFG